MLGIVITYRFKGYFQISFMEPLLKGWSVSRTNKLFIYYYYFYYFPFYFTIKYYFL